MLCGRVLQVLDTYMPGATSSDAPVTRFNYTSVPLNVHRAGCNADKTIFRPARTYMCTDIFFMEEAKDSLLADRKNYMDEHVQSRHAVEKMLETRGFRYQCLGEKARGPAQGKLEYASVFAQDLLAGDSVASI